MSLEPTRLGRGLVPVVVALAVLACGRPALQVQTGAPLVDADLAMSWSHAENRKSDDFSEQLVVRGALADGASLYAKLTVTNLASADGRADLSISVTLPEGRKLQFREKRDRDDWTFATDRFGAEVGDGGIEVGVGHARIHCKNDDFELDAVIESALPPLRPKGGLARTAAGYYVTTIPIPRGHLAMKVTVLTDAEPPDEDEHGREDKEPATPEPATPAPEPATPAPESATPESATPETATPEADEELPRTYELEGAAYAEHRAGTIAPYALAHRWHGIVDVAEDRTVIFSAFEHAHDRTPGAAEAAPRVQGWVLAANDDGFEVYEPELQISVQDWRTDDTTSYPIPGLVFMRDPAGATFEAVIKPDTLSERKDDLSGLKKIERLVVKRFMKPWTFRFDHARFLMREQPAGQPMHEVRGEARYQYQQLNP